MTRTVGRAVVEARSLTVARTEASAGWIAVAATRRGTPSGLIGTVGGHPRLVCTRPSAGLGS